MWWHVLQSSLGPKGSSCEHNQTTSKAGCMARICYCEEFVTVNQENRYHAPGLGPGCLGPESASAHSTKRPWTYAGRHACLISLMNQDVGPDHLEHQIPSQKHIIWLFFCCDFLLDWFDVIANSPPISESMMLWTLIWPQIYIYLIITFDINVLTCIYGWTL